MRFETKFGSFNIKSCEEEPLTIPETVQEFGYLLGFETSSEKLHFYSKNVEDLWNKKAPLEPIQISDMLSDGSYVELKKVLSQSPSKLEHYTLTIDLKPSFFHKLNDEGYIWESTIYESGCYTILEVEPATYKQLRPLSVEASLLYTKTLKPTINQKSSISHLYKKIVEAIRLTAGFDRVMIYKFNEGGDGTVVGESKIDELNSFLGLRFPATDIPKQARALYVLNGVRIIPNVDYKPVPIVDTPLSTRKECIDLSQSSIRSISPIHIQYLKNMNVSASMSISLVIEDKLWGLIACHHTKPRHLNLATRRHCELIGHLVSSQIAAYEAKIEKQRLSKKTKLIGKLIYSISTSPDRFNEVLEANQDTLLELLDADGFILRFSTDSISFGDLPSPIVLDKLTDYLASQKDTVVSSNNISMSLEDKNLSEEVCGYCAVVLDASRKFYAMWFRKEEVKEVVWGGKPKDRSIPSEESLTPRKSFEAWADKMTGKCRPWTISDKDIASRFNELLLRHVIERIRLHEESLKKMKQLDEGKDRFIASVSHELRTPLNAILGWADLGMMSTAPGSATFEALDVIKKSAVTQNMLISDLIDAAKIAAGNMKLDLKPVNVQELILDIKKSFEAATIAKKIEIDTSMVESELTVISDSIRIRQALWNLIGNAIKFTPKGGKITVQTKRNNSSVDFIIKDNGRGISREGISHIFSQFYQENADKTSAGLGLGLSITKNIIELHGGQIFAYSEGLNRGSTFTVRLPTSPVKDDEDIQLAGAASNELGEDEVAFEGELAKVRILVAEDDQHSSTLLQLLLTKHGASVTLCMNGKLALETLEQNDASFDLVISDLGMPEMSGIELVSAIRSLDNDRLKKIPCIALTAYVQASDRAGALKAGFDSYVPKPIHIEELLAVIKTTLRR